MPAPEINKAGAKNLLGRIKSRQVMTAEAIDKGHLQEARNLISEMQGLLYALRWNTKFQKEARKAQLLIKEVQELLLKMSCKENKEPPAP